MIKIFTIGNSGKIELTKEELEKILNEVYQNGYRDGYAKTVNPRIITDYDVNVNVKPLSTSNFDKVTTSLSSPVSKRVASPNDVFDRLHKELNF